MWKALWIRHEFLRAGRPWATVSCPPPRLSVRAQPCSKYSHNLNCPIDDCCTCFLFLLKLFPLLQPNQSAWWGRWLLQISVTCGLYPRGGQLSPPSLFFFILKGSIFCSALSCTSCPPSLLRVRTIMVIDWLSFNKKVVQWGQLLWTCGLFWSLTEQFSDFKPFSPTSITLPTSAV